MNEERWHNFAKEKPSEDMEGRNFIVSNGHYEKIATWCGYWENEPFMGDRLCDEVVRWKFYFTPEEEKANEATRTELKAYNVVASSETENYINGETNLAFEAYDADAVDTLLAEKDKDVAYWRKEYDEETKLTDALKAEIESLKASELRYNTKPAPEFIEPMVYTREVQEPREGVVIAQGFYNGLNYYVKNIKGRHPAAYVEIPQGHKAYNMNFDSIQDDYVSLEVHYGVTYEDNVLLAVDNEGSRGHKFVGWDYGHAGDFEGHYIGMGGVLETSGKRWTTEEIVEECKSAIDQINAL